jgi:tRNA threonylcarbamoyl adenosine modification protein (Sua5/YciO/YrdC/YwlC family)
MKIIPLSKAEAHVDDIAAVVAGGGLACIPLRGAYRIIADARSESAITRLAQSKRRAHNRPALILVADLAAACEIVDGTAWPLTLRATKKLWPGPLTLVLPPSKRLPAKINKLLSRSTSRIGIRVPDDALTASILEKCGGPLLVSSANIENKPGSTSAAAVRQRFSRTVDIWIDAGDIRPEPPSTLVDISETGWELVREGAIARAVIERALA